MTRLTALVAFLAVVGAAAPLPNGGVGPLAVQDAEAQGASLLRSRVRTQTRAVTEQIRRAIRPSLKILRGDTGPVTSASVSTDGRYMVTSLGDSSMRVWDLQNGNEVTQVRPETGVLGSASIGPNGDVVAAIDSQGQVVVASPWEQEQQRFEQPRNARATASQLSGDSARLLVGRSDGSVGLIAVATQTPVVESQPLGLAVTAVAMSPDGTRIAAGYQDGRVQLWEAPPAGAAPQQNAVPAAEWLTGAAVTALRLVDGNGAGENGGTVALVGDGQGVMTAFGYPSRGQLGRWQAHRSPVTAISDQRGGTMVTGADDGHVTAWRLPLGAPVAELAQSGPRVNSVALSQDGRTAFVAGASGSVQLIDLEQKVERAKMISTESGWVVIDDKGRFDGNASGLKDVGWDADKQVLPVGNFSAKYFEPGMAAKQLGTTSAPILTADAPPVNDGILLPPAVQVELRTQAPYQSGQTIEVRVVASDDGGGGLEVMKLFQNGKRLEDTALVDRQEETQDQTTRWTLTYRVVAAPGANEVAAVARGWSGIESEPQAVSFQAPLPQQPQQQPAVEARIAGVNKYGNPRWNLDYAVADAQSMADLIRERSTGLYNNVNVRLITDAGARRNDVISMIEGLKNTKPNDVVIVFLSGHGRAIGNDWYFMPHEMTDLEDDNQAKTVGVSALQISEMLVGVPAQRILLIIDACESGAAANRFDNFAQRRAMQGVSRDTGVFVLAATRADQLAPEYPALKHGLFTYTLLVGMKINKKGTYNADESPPDNTVTAAELKNYVERNVPVLARLLDLQIQKQVGTRGQLAQRAPVTPTGLALGTDFALSTVQ